MGIGVVCEFWPVDDRADIILSVGRIFVMGMQKTSERLDELISVCERRGKKVTSAQIHGSKILLTFDGYKHETEDSVQPIDLIKW